MSELRRRAEVEKADLEEQARARQLQAERERREKRRAFLKPAADFLTQWAGIKVTPDNLHDVVPDRGPARWSLTLDGFKLMLEATGKKDKFTIIQCHPDSPNEDLYRIVEKPADLLAEWAIAVRPIAEVITDA